jgi:hypothetical protein
MAEVEFDPVFMGHWAEHHCGSSAITATCAPRRSASGRQSVNYDRVHSHLPGAAILDVKNVFAWRKVVCFPNLLLG